MDKMKIFFYNGANNSGPCKGRANTNLIGLG